MNALIKPNNHFTKWITSIFLLMGTFLISSAIYGQAGDLSQIRNGSGQTKNGVLDACGDCWVNGNAGAQNAHYVEGMSIAYRSLITGLTPGVCYEYEIGYDTYHGAMAIDYLTHFQRLEPHGPFGHPAEVIDPLVFVSGSTKYSMPAQSTNTFAIPAPAPSGIASGAYNKDGTPRDVSNQALTSFNALPAAQRLMTIYNGVIQDINYVSQATIVIGGADAETRVRIRFQADDDSVVLAWGGHIASRLDWGYSIKQGKLVPLSAAGISGSPYHMRQKAMDRVQCDANPANATQILEVLTGFGNQDRSLSAAAVVPPPECPTVPSQTICAGDGSFTFTISNPEAGATYTWAIVNDNVGAAFQGGANTGNSVTIVPSSGSTFETGGTFSLNITASLNAIDQLCEGVATGTVEKVVVDATANPTQIDITSAAHSTTLTADIVAGSTDLNNANYTYQWSIVTAGTSGSLTNATSRIATYTAGIGDAGSSITFKVIATQAADANSPECLDDDEVTITVSSVGACDVTPQGPVCQGATTTHNGSPNPIPSTATYTWVLSGYGGAGTTTSTLASANGGLSMQVNATQSYRITLNQVYENTAANTSCYEDVQVIPTPTIATTYNAPDCDENTFSVTVGSAAKPVVAGASYSITDKNGGAIAGVSPASPYVAPNANNFDFTNIPAGSGYIVTVTTATASCTASDNCGSPDPSIGRKEETTLTEEAINNKKEEAVAEKGLETFDIELKSGTQVKAMPNPFTDRIRFNLVSGVSGMGSLELFNVMGQKVGVVYQGYIQAGRPFNQEYNVPETNRNALIYVFKVGDQQVTGKLMGLRQ